MLPEAHPGNPGCGRSLQTPSTLLPWSISEMWPLQFRSETAPNSPGGKERGGTQDTARRAGSPSIVLPSSFLFHRQPSSLWAWPPGFPIGSSPATTAPSRGRGACGRPPKPRGLGAGGSEEMVAVGVVTELRSEPASAFGPGLALATPLQTETLTRHPDPDLKGNQAWPLNP